MSREHEEHQVFQIGMAMTKDFDRKFLGAMISQLGGAERLLHGLDEGIKSIQSEDWDMFYEEFMGNFGPEESK